MDLSDFASSKKRTKQNFYKNRHDATAERGIRTNIHYLTPAGHSESFLSAVRWKIKSEVRLTKKGIRKYVSQSQQTARQALICTLYAALPLSLKFHLHQNTAEFHPKSAKFHSQEVISTNYRSKGSMKEI